MGTPVRHQKKHYYSVNQTLFEIDTKYVSVKYIGEGAYGVVCSFFDKETKERVAIKKIFQVFDDRMDALQTLRELKLLRHLRHENVILLKDVMIPTNKRRFNDVYLVFELMDKDLRQVIESTLTITDHHCQYFLYQLLRGLQYLHSSNVLHRDLKPTNLLVNLNTWKLKICDFGFARTSNGTARMAKYVGTLGYRAPELLLSCNNYGPAIDMWSVGCIFAELLGKEPLFQGTGHVDQLKMIINILGSPEEEDLEFIDNQNTRTFIKSLPYTGRIPLHRRFPNADLVATLLLQKMLVFDPSKRISVTDALQHPYLHRMYDRNNNPPAPELLDLDYIDKLGIKRLREIIWEEMLHYHPTTSGGAGA